MSHHQKNSRRFDEFEEFKNRKGFFINERGRDIPFYYDHLGGWFDEFGNYFDCEARPSQPSKESLRFWDSIRHEYQDMFDDVDNLINEYQNDDYEDDEDQYYDYERDMRLDQEISTMRNRMKHYSDTQEIKISFVKVNWQVKEDAFYREFGKENIKHIHFDENRQKIRTGDGYIIAKNKAAGLEIIKKHGTEINGQEIRFHVEPIDHFDSDEEVVEVKQDLNAEAKKDAGLEKQPQLEQKEKNVQSASDEQGQPKQQQQPQQQKANNQEGEAAQGEKHVEEAGKQKVVKEVKLLVKLEKFDEKQTQQQIKQWIEQKNKKEQINFEKIEVIQKKDKSYFARIYCQNKTIQQQTYKLFESNQMYQGKYKLALTLCTL